VVPPGPAPLRIAYLLSQYPAVNHVFMAREVRRLRALGIEIHTFSVSAPDRPPSSMTDVEREEAAVTHYIKDAGPAHALGAHIATLFSRPAGYFRGLRCALGTGRRALYGLAYFTEALVFGRAMLRLGLVHLHTHFASTVALIAARTFPVTMSATFHGPAEFENPESFRLAEKVRASLFSCAISRYGLSRLMYVTDPAEWHKLEWTPLGVDPAEFAPRPFRPEPSPYQIVCVGRLAPVKGQHILIGAVEAMVREGHDILLRLVGDGPDRPALERQVADRGLSGHIVFAGNVDQNRLLEIYREADAAVLASFGEGLPVVLMEAMAMEIPCVATWVAGVPELIRDGIDGLLVPPADQMALAQAILRLKNDPDLRLRLAREGRRRVLEGYDLAANAGRLADVFRRRLRAAS
jgi:colanic acid/amylovoran biosynthesis glycosyltransferase